MVPTGVAIALPDGYAAFVHPRSGLAHRFGVGMVNAPGTVDAGYRGEIKVLLVNHDRADHRPAAPRRPDRPARRAAGRAGAVPAVDSCRARPAARAATGPPVASPTAGVHRRRATDSRRRRQRCEHVPQSADRATRTTRSTTDDTEDRRRRGVDDGDGDAEAAGGPPAGAPGPCDAVRGRRPGRDRPGRPGRPLAARAGPGSRSGSRPTRRPAEVVAVTLVLGEGALQVQPFAAPRQRGHLGRGARRDPGRHHQAGRHGRRGRGTARHRAAHPGAGPRADGSPACSPPGSSASTGRAGSCAACSPAGRPRSQDPTPRCSRCSVTSSWSGAPARWRLATRSR